MDEPAPLIALTTDFGLSSPYVAQVKGVLLSALPRVRLLDVAHDVPAHSIRHAEVILRVAAFAFPIGTVHIVVVDPGVGTSRRPLAVEAAGMFFVGPDNGVLGIALEQPGAVCVVLDRPHLFRQPLSSTFHGRDLFAPVAAELAAGLPISEAGSLVHDAVPSTLPRPVRHGGRVRGVTLVEDTFGNLLTNIPSHWCGPSPVVTVGGKRATWVHTYGEGPASELLAMAGSDGFVEIAMKQQSAAQALSGGVDLEVVCETTTSASSASPD
jgi:S-adenosyl-L-methionine hydrolase (adenosine-forming)